VLAADDVLLREGLAGMLDRSGFELVGRAGNASDLSQVAGRATDFDDRVLAAGSALAAGGRMRAPATAPSQRMLAAMTWKPIAARLKTHGHDAHGKPSRRLVVRSPVTCRED
jgi:hypothetical protein